MNRQRYKAQASGLEPTLIAGKSGIEMVVDELIKQLKIKKMVKVKLLRTALLEMKRQELAVKLADLTGSELIEVRGNTAVFRRKE